MTDPPKKSKAPKPNSADARNACRTPAEQEQLARIIKAGWTSAELSEYARLYFSRNGRDYPTPTSYRRAIGDIVRCSKWRDVDEEPSYDDPLGWLELFRKGGSKLLPPRRPTFLQPRPDEPRRVTHL